jgi:Cu/Ag efflux pump CusA
MRLAALVAVAAAVVLIFGVNQLRRAPVDIYPEFTSPQVQIQTEALGLSAAEVESLITVPMEAELNGVPWVDTIRSESVPGLSSIDLIFHRGTDISRARQLVTERLAQGPGVAKVGSPPVMIRLSSDSRVMMVGLQAKDLSLIEMSVLARWKIRPRLMGIPGVANVAIWGQRDRQLQVQVDPARLHKYGIALNKVIDTAGNALWSSPLTFVEASTPGADGFIDTPNQRLGIEHILPISTAGELASVTFEDAGGRTLHIGDVANVTEDHQPLIGDALLKDGQGLLLVVQKSPGADTAKVTKAVEDAMNELKPGLTGISIDTHAYRPATYLDSALHSVGLAALIGLVAVTVLIAVVVYSWRVAVVALTSIGTALVAAAYVLYLTGATFNMMVLAGLLIATGAVIDDAVTDTVAIKRRLHRRGDGASVVDTVRAGSLEARGPLGYAFVVVLLSALPIFVLGGVSGAFAKPLIGSYALGLGTSLLVALTVTPALAFLLLPAEHPRRSPVARLGARVFRRVVTHVLARPRWAYAGLVVLLAALVGGLVAAGPALGGGRSLIPAPQDRDLLVRWQAAPGTSLPEMDRVTANAAAQLRALPAVADVAAHVGRAVTGDQIADVDSGEMWVALKPSADYARAVAAVRHVVDGYTDMRHQVLTYAQDQLDTARARPNRPVTVRVYGQEFHILGTQAEQVRQTIAKVPGVTAARVESPPLVPTIEIQVDLAKAQKYGLKPGDVRRAAATLVSGLLVGNLYENQRIFDVVVVGEQRLHDSVSDVGNLLLDAPDGRQVRLQDVASVDVRPNPPVITHEGATRAVDVTADVRGRSVDAVLGDVRKQLRGMTFPLEYHAVVQDDRPASEDASVAIIALVAATGIFLVLQAAFHSWRRAGLLFVLVPLAGSGGVLAAAGTADGLNSAGALIGLLMAFGMAVRAGVPLVRRYQILEDGAGIAEAVATGTRNRAMPTVLGLLTTAAVLTPFAVMDGPGFELTRPLAIVALGGLASTGVVMLCLLPVLYLRLVSPPRPVSVPPPPPAKPTAVPPEPSIRPEGDAAQVTPDVKEAPDATDAKRPEDFEEADAEVEA